MDGVHYDDSGTNDHEQSSVMNEKHACSVPEVGTIQELGKSLHDTLLVKDENLSGDSDLDQEGSVARSCKCLQKCVTFPISFSDDATPKSQPENKCCIRSMSLPAESSKPVSALKGSREKEGAPPRKLSVSWAPDVYDPAPTSLSHYPKKKVQQPSKSNKKHGKGKQKGKAMRGGGSGPKDKKHHRKVCGRSDRCLDSFADTDRVLTSKSCNSSLGLLGFDDDFDIGSPDSNCGSSFLQAGGTKHCIC